MAFLALHDVLLGEHQVVDDRAGVGPGAEQVVALEETVVAVARMGNHQCLHAHGVLFHEVGNAGVGVDHDLVGQPHLATLVVLFGMQELLAVGPVVIAQRHAHRGIGVHHLLGGNHLDLVRIGIQRVAFGDAADFAVVLPDQVEGPFRAGGNGLSFHAAHLSWSCAAGRVRGTPDRCPRRSPVAVGRTHRKRLRRPGCIRTRAPGVRAG